MRTVVSRRASAGSSEGSPPAHSSFIRGVNLGGWLLLERFITPYLFAITSCHLEGDFCWYRGQLSAPPIVGPHEKLCDINKCTPHMITTVTGEKDFPVDEYTLTKSFPNKIFAKNYLNYHRDNFVTKKDLEKAKNAGVTHIRVPMPHWILGDILDDEPWVDGGWIYFNRLVGWCRELGLEVWPDIHTAPGSQNGFDNSGQLKAEPTCSGWSNSPENVKRSLRAVESITSAIKEDGMTDVVTGFGVLNEPFKDCSVEVVRQFNRDALKIVRKELGADAAVYIGDLFNATKWNDGWWTEGPEYSNTYLDSHYYHVFAEEPRALSPKQHIAYVCGKNFRDTTSCCYKDAPDNKVPSGGISRFVGEWSASFDTLPVAKLTDVMNGIAKTGDAPEFNRTLSNERKNFLKHFVQAQMVTYEAVDTGLSSGWFYWTMKMEGGAFAEWDFLRGVEEGWIEKLQPPDSPSEKAFGTCHQIASVTNDDMGIVNEFPDPSTLPASNWQGVDIDDDYVLTHADSQPKQESPKENKKDTKSVQTVSQPSKPETHLEDSNDKADEEGVHGESHTGRKRKKSGRKLLVLIACGFASYAVWQVFLRKDQGRLRSQYQSIGTETSLVV